MRELGTTIQSGIRKGCGPRFSERAMRSSRIVGSAFLAHFAALAWLKVVNHEPGEMFWISHVSLLLAGVALVLGSSRLAAVALVNVLGVHALWLFDAIVGSVTGQFPVGVTNYLATCDGATLAGTLHHVYLAPVLLWWLVARGTIEPGDWWRALLGGVVLMAVLCVVSRLVLPASINANVAHALFPASTSRAFIWYNGLDWWWYLAIHVPVWSVVFMVPGALVVRACQGASRSTRFGLWAGRLAW